MESIYYLNFYNLPTETAHPSMTEPTQQTDSQPQTTIAAADESATKEFNQPKVLLAETD
jgi:hypothetical protein